MNVEIIKSVAQSVRDQMVLLHPVGLNGACIEASDLIAEALIQQGMTATVVEGWCLYEKEDYGSDRDFDEHTWVEVTSGDEVVFVDVTLDQFQGGMYQRIEPIVIGDMPEFLVMEKPESDFQSDMD